MSRRASRPGRRSEPTPPDFIVERAYPETAREDAISLRDSPSDDPIVPGVSPSDDPRGWGETPDSNDQRLRDSIPPHW